MKTLSLLLLAAGLAGLSVAATSRPAEQSVPAELQPAGDWASDPIWYDGLVEKTTYAAVKTIYGEPRSYEATFLTNKEQHDRATWTKANGSTDTVEVWKHNQIEVVPTPNYDYKFITTSHFTTDALKLTRFDCTSQEWCGTSFKQFMQNGDDGYEYFGFSYMPEAGRTTGTVEASDKPIVPFNGLSLFLRGYDFEAREPLNLWILPDQKSNRATKWKPQHATARFVEETDDGYRLSVDTSPAGEGQMSIQVNLGLFVFAKDRQHVMLSANMGNGDTYELKSQERVNYWTLPK